MKLGRMKIACKKWDGCKRCGRSRVKLGWGFIIIKMVVVKDKNFKIISTSKKSEE